MSDPTPESEHKEPESEQDAPEIDETREPGLTPSFVTDADTEFKKQVLDEKAAHGLDQLEGPDIKAVIHEEEESAADEAEIPEDSDDTEAGTSEKLDDLFDPPGYYDADAGGPVGPEDADVGVRDSEVEGPRRQVGEAAHNPPVGQAPKEAEEEEEGS